MIRFSKQAIFTLLFLAFFNFSNFSQVNRSVLNDRFSDTNGGAEPGFTVSDIRGGCNFRREHYRLSFNAGVRNLFDRFYDE